MKERDNAKEEAIKKLICIGEDISKIETGIAREKRLLGKEDRDDNSACDTGAEYLFTVRIKDGKPVETTHTPASIKVTGYSPREFDSDPDLWIKMVHKDDRKMVTERISDILSGKRAPSFEHRIIRKDGVLRWVKNSITLHFDKDGVLTSYTGVIQDIARIKNAENVLRISDEEYRILAETLPVAAYVAALDESSSTLYISPQIKSILSFTSEEYMSDPQFWNKHIHPEDSGRVMEELRRCHRDLGSFLLEYRMLDRFGQVVWIHDTATVTRDIEGKALYLHGMMFDITELKQIEEDLSKKQCELQTILDSVPALVFYKDRQNRMVRINKSFAEAMGMKKEEIEGKTCFELWPDKAQEYWCDDKEVIDKGYPKIGIIESLMTAKGEKWIDTDKIPYKNEEGDIIGVIGFAIDITERRMAEDALKKSKEEYCSLINNVNIGVFRSTYEAEGYFINVNPAMVKIFGYDSSEEFMKTSFFELYQDPHRRVEYTEKIRRQGFVKDEVLGLKKKDGTPIWVSVTAKVGFDENGAPQCVDGIAEDITERRRAEEELGLLNKELLRSNKRLKQLALRDQQTGLFNHRYLQDVIEAEFFRAKRYMHPFSVMMMDVDYFKSINDVYGHIFGDLVLKQLSRQLKRMVRQYDIVIRFGGEEFVIISPGIDRVGALKLAERILDAITLYNFGDKNHMVKLKLSIAVSSYPEDKIVNGMDLVEIADKILDKLKEVGGNNVYSSLDIKKKQPSNRKPKIDVGILKERIQKLTKQTNQSLIEAVFAFAKTIELKDQYTGEHVEMTVHYATEISRALNLPDDETERIKQAAILHDLGKIGISERILAKKSKLTKEEFEEIIKSN